MTLTIKYFRKNKIREREMMEGGREGRGRKNKWNEERKTEGERKEEGLRG